MFGKAPARPRGARGGIVALGKGSGATALLTTPQASGVPRSWQVDSAIGTTMIVTDDIKGTRCENNGKSHQAWPRAGLRASDLLTLLKRKLVICAKKAFANAFII